MARATRKLGYKEQRTSFYILTEGKTEVIYFSTLRQAWRVGLTVECGGDNTLNLVRKAVSVQKKDLGYDQIWVVFDRDEFPAQDFNEAFRLAERNDIGIAYSNACFELWLFLHLAYLDTGLSRQLLYKKLQETLPTGYGKTNIDAIEHLLGSIDTAINNSRNLLATHPLPLNPIHANPSTTIHLLVEELKKTANT